MKTAKLIQLVGLLITIVASVALFAAIVTIADRAEYDYDEPVYFLAFFSFLAVVAGIFTFIAGRTIAWWNRD